VGIAHLVEILRDLDLHIIRDDLILLDALIQFMEFVAVVLAQQLTHHAKHAMNALGKTHDFLLCLEHRQLGSLHDAHLNEAQSEVVLVVVGAGLDEPTHHLFNLRDEPYQQGGVGHVEAGVECRQHNGQEGSLLRHRVVGLHGVIAHH